MAVLVCNVESTRCPVSWLEQQYQRSQSLESPYHDHIRVLPQNGAQAFREGHIGFQINLCLPNSFHVILNGSSTVRMLREVVQLVKASVQRG